MQKLPDITKDFAAWYNEVIHQAGLVDDGPSRGSMIIKPYGYAIWENISKVLDSKIKDAGAQNAYFPLLIPQHFITKEAKHIEGFAPELAVVTHAGGKKLEEPLVIRPTSETVVYHMFAKWIKSWRDLPLKINQWANVVRWEMRTRPFLRSTEFLWQEGHTAHHDRLEAVEMAKHMLAEYKDLAESYLAIPVITGEKCESERFAGADHTFTFEAMMQDGKALQMGTSHVLAHSFPKAFGVEFQDKDGKMQSPYCTSWGATTRLIGAMVMVHGDQSGLVIPPRVAPIQVVFVPIARKDDERAAVMAKADELAVQLKNQGIRAHIDADEKASPGAKFYHWEQCGVPIRIEIGPRDLQNGQVVAVNRVEADKDKKKTFVSFDQLTTTCTQMLESIHDTMFARALEYSKRQWHDAQKLSEFGQKMADENGFYTVGWCQSVGCEEQLKKYKGTIRCLLETKNKSHCFACDKPSLCDTVVAKAY